MVKRARYLIVFAPETVEHLQAIDQKHHGEIADAIEEQLPHTPDLETRNRKPLAEPGVLGSTWELRCGPQNRFRVFYDVLPDDLQVHILGIGVKERNKLFIAGKEVTT